MPEFMIMILSNEADESQLAPSETKALVEGHSAYEKKLRAASAYLDGERLRPSAEGKRIGTSDGRARVTVGPFEETAFGGYYLVKADTLDAAVALAEACPMAEEASLDVRPIMASHIKPEKASRPGRVFAFAVLGNAATERGWIEVMDRIEERTRDGFPNASFLGGLRLDAPGRGRRVTSAGGLRAIFVGPFLESKDRGLPRWFVEK